MNISIPNFMKKHFCLEKLGVLLIHFVLVFYYLNPIFKDISNVCLGNGHSADSAIYLWNTFNFSTGHVSTTDHVFFPEGASLVFNTSTYFIGLINLITQNPYLAANLSLVFSFVCYGFGVFMLSKYVLKNSLAALAVSILATYTINHLLHVQEHFNLMLFFPVPYFIFYCFKSLDFSQNKIRLFTVKYIPHLIFIFFISLLCDYQVAFFILYFSLYAFITFFTVRLLQKWKWKAVLLVLLFFYIFHSTFIFLLKKELLQVGEGFWFTPDLFSFFIPFSEQHPLGNSFFNEINSIIHNSGQPFESSPFLSFTVLSVACFAIIWNITQKAFKTSQTIYLLLIALFFVMTIFPQLKYKGEPIFYFPTAITHVLPLLQNLRCPGRFTTMMALFVPLATLFLLKNDKKITIICSILLITGFLIETPAKQYETFHNQKNATNEYLAQLNTESIFHIPVGIRDGSKGFGEFQMHDFLDQIEHKKKINNGYLSRIKPEIFAYYENDLLYQRLTALQEGKKATSLSKKEAKQAIDKFKITTIVLRNNAQQTSLDEFISQSFEQWIVDKITIEQNIIYHLK